MNIERLHHKFQECNSTIDIDSRLITKGSMFFAIKGENYDGNEFALEALRNGAKIAVIDSEEISFNKNDNIIKVDDSLKTLQNLATFHYLSHFDRSKTYSYKVGATTRCRLGR